jgi:hypothetical protein
MERRKLVAVKINPAVTQDKNVGQSNRSCDVPLDGKCGHVPRTYGSFKIFGLELLIH